MALDVKFLRGRQSDYDAAAASAAGVDSKAFYFTEDEGNAYIGSHQLNNDALDVNEFSLGTVSGSILTISGIKEVDGKIAKGTDTTKDITLAKVAMTGSAADVNYDNTTSGLLATEIQAAIDELAEASSGGVASKTIWVHDDSAGQSDYAKVYTIYQGENDYVKDRTDGKTNPILKGTINIPKDKVVQNGAVVQIFFDSSDNTLHEGSISGPDVTALIMGSTTPTEANAGPYIKLILQNVTDPLYIAASALVDVYTGGTTTEATVAVTDGVITVSINNIDGSKIVYKAETSAGAGDGETVKQALTRLDGADSVTGSVANKIKVAIEDLDATADGTKTAINGSIARVAGNADSVFALQGIVETDGKLSGMTVIEAAQIGAAGSGRTGSGTEQDPYVYADTIKGAKWYAEDKAAAAGSAAIESLDVNEFALGTISGSIITIGGISETDGKIAAGVDPTKNITFAKVAATGKAEDTELNSATSAKFDSATDVDSALSEIATALTWGSI